MLYLIPASIVLAVLLIFYKVFLSKESFFKWNRWFLLGSIALSLCLPLLPVPQMTQSQGFITSQISPIVSESNVNPTIIPFTEGCEDQPADPSALVTTSSLETPSSNTMTSVVEWRFWVYIFGVVVLLGKFALQIVAISNKIKNNSDQIETENGVIVNLSEVAEPCSFFKFIFINPSQYEYEVYEQIIEHEEWHVKFKHSVDLIIAELVLAVFWFNPFAWLLRGEIEKNLEFQVDEMMTLQSEDKSQSYQLNLLEIACKTGPLSITINYNQSLIKSRIVKMNSKRSNRFNSWKYSFVLPVFVILCLAINVPVTNSQAIIPVDSASSDNGNTLFPADGDGSTVCDQAEIAAKEKNYPELRRLLSYEDISCMTDTKGGPSPHIEIVQGLLLYGADMSIDHIGVVHISPIGFQIKALDPEFTDCRDENYIALSKAIFEEDEDQILEILSTKEFSCPLNVDGVSNDFPFIRTLTSIGVDIEFNQQGAITV